MRGPVATRTTELGKWRHVEEWFEVEGTEPVAYLRSVRKERISWWRRAVRYFHA